LWPSIPSVAPTLDPTASSECVEKEGGMELYLQKAHAWPTWTNKSQQQGRQQSKSNIKSSSSIQQPDGTFPTHES
jgi:hypothetical protein